MYSQDNKAIVNGSILLHITLLNRVPVSFLTHYALQNGASTADAGNFMQSYLIMHSFSVNAHL